MQRAMDETARRRRKQLEFNALHGIVPRGIVKQVVDVMEGARADGSLAGQARSATNARGTVGAGSRRGITRGAPGAAAERAGSAVALRPEQALRRMKQLETEMFRCARNLEFEEAARLRDEIEQLRRAGFGLPGVKAG
jgi:excinuclease ABC subunit B